MRNYLHTILLMKKTATSRINTGLSKLSEKKHNLISTWTNDLNRYFTVDDIWIENKQDKKYSIIFSHHGNSNYKPCEMALHICKQAKICKIDYTKC